MAPRGWKTRNSVSAGLLDLGCAFFIPILLSLAVLIFPTMLLISYTAAPETLHGFVCEGALFPTCDLPVCIEFQNSTIGDGMVKLDRWSSCHNETTSRIRAQSCIFDNALFERTDGFAGWDLCEEDAGVSQAIIIEDSFEQAVVIRNFWDEETNGEISDRCGGAVRTSKAMTFSGTKMRIATTIPLDVRYGGQINFAIKYPKGFEDDCATLYSGEVT